MLRWILFSFALLLAALSLLTTFQAPDWLPWKTAVVAGEYGYWLIALPVWFSVLAWRWRRSGRGVAAGTALLCGVCIAGLLKPSVQAWRIGGSLPGELEQAFGRVEVKRAPFSPAGFFRGGPAARVARTHEYAPGLALDFFRAEGRGGSPAPCVIVVHGGGWDSGDRDQVPQLNHWLAERGYAVAAISYRLAPKFQWPAQRADTLAALAFLKSRSGELGIDPTRFVLLGRSAGGQIAQATGYTAHDAAIRGVVGLYAPSDLIFGYVNTHENDMLKSPALMRLFLGGTPESARANYESASAIYHVNRTTPPTLLLHGTNDALVWYRHSVRLDVRLAEAGVPRAYVALPWATHAFEFNLNGPGGQLTTYALEWFLAAVTR